MDPATPPSLIWVMTLRVEVAAPLELGDFHGTARRLIPITGGVFDGPQLRGAVLPGGADWQQTRSDDVAVLDARYMLQTSGGDLISVTNRGFRHGPSNLRARFTAGQRVPPTEYYFVTAPLFETSAPDLQWLTRSIFIGVGEREQNCVILRVWKAGDDPRS